MENRLLTLISESVNEAINNILLERKRTWTHDDEPLAWEFYEDYGPSYVFWQFKKNPNQNNMWGPLINPNEYAKALDEFVQYGKLVRFPTQRVYQWIGLCMKNIALLNACTSIYGHNEGWPIYDFIEVFFDDDEDLWQECCEENGLEPDDYDEYLDNIGFTDWCDNGTDTLACSDFGLQPLMKLANSYKEDMSPEQVLVLINRIIDVTHANGDLSSLFIKGGKYACDKISNSRSKVTGDKIYCPF